MEKTLSLSNYFRSGLHRFFSGIMLSRLSGLGRDLAMAYAFGDHPMVGAFIIAFRFANIFRRFFGEGPLQSAFIPQFEELKNRDSELAYVFFRKLSLIIGGLTSIIIGVGHIGIRTILGFCSEENQQILILVQWILPSLFFISLYGLNISFLQCHGRFFISSMAPFLCNMMWIAGALTLKNLPMKQAMLGLAKFVLVGFIIQWMVTAFQMLSQMGTKKWIIKNLFQSEVKNLAKSAILGVLGVGALQVNSFFDVIFARYTDPSAPVYLWYANRFQQLALAVFGIATVNTLIPLLSRAVKKGEIEIAQKIFSFGCRRLILMMLPITCGICVLGFSAIYIVFGRGNFTLYAAHQTTRCLIAYGLGLLPATLVIYYSAVLHAKNNFKIPALFSLSAVGVNIVLNTFFVFGLELGPISIALATSIGAWYNFISLHTFLKKIEWRIGYQLKEFFLLITGALIASGLSYKVEAFFSDKIYNFIASAAVFILFLAVYGLVFKNSLFNHCASKTNLSLIKNH